MILNMNKNLHKYYLMVLDRLAKVSWTTKRMTFKVLKMTKEELEKLALMDENDFYDYMLKLENN